MRLSRRLLALRRRLGAAAAPEERPGAGSAADGPGALRGAAGDPYRQRAAVHGMAGRDGIRDGAAAAGDQAPEVEAAASADLGEDRALLEDAVGRVFVPYGLPQLRGSARAAAALPRRLQLPASPPGAGGIGAGRPVFPPRPRGAKDGGAGGAEERAALGAREAHGEAFLSGGEAGRPRGEHRRLRGGAAGAGGQGGGADDPFEEGGGR